MRRWWVVSFVGLCIVAAASPALSKVRTYSQPVSDRDPLQYILPKPLLQLSALQEFLRNLRGGESTDVKLADPSGPRMARYRYSGREFKGYYWEERVADRDALDLLWVWITGFQASCKGRFATETEPPARSGGKMVHSGFWACTEEEIKMQGYISVLHLGSTARFYFTLPSIPDPKAAEAIGTQIRASLIELISAP